MSMEPAQRMLRYSLAVVLVALLGGLSGWYLYLRSHEASMASTDAARGLQSGAPAYEGAFGSAAPATTSSATPTPQAPQQARRLWRADQGPVAGFSFVAEKAATTSVALLYFAERGSGYLFAADAGKEAVERLTDTLLPKTYEALFSPSPGTVLMRSLDTAGRIATQRGEFTTPAATTTLPQALLTSALPNGISALTFEPDGSIFYLVPQALGGASGSLLPPGGKAKAIYSSFLAGWLPEIGHGKIILVQKAADGVPGYAYALSGSGALSPLLGPLPGLEVLPHPSTSALLFSTASGARLALFAQTGAGAGAQLPVATVASKCVWAPGASLIAYCAVPSSLPQSGFLEAWYQGAFHSSDSWWQIDVAGKTAQEIYTPSQALDVHDPGIDPSGSYIAFVNGADRSLWVLRIAP